MEVNENDQHSIDDIESQNEELMESDGFHEDESSDGYVESDSDGGDSDDELDEQGDAIKKQVCEDITEDESGVDVADGVGVDAEDAMVNEGDSNKEDEPKKLKKIAPHKQKPLIHKLLKRSKIYEIRKLTRRSNMLKSAKGTEEQQAKKQRKAERLRKEIEAIRGFMIDELTDRTVNVFKGKSEEVYNEMWKACEDPIKINDMIQILSNKTEENFSDIAYFRMLSSKDILSKFQQIASGENLSHKPKKTKLKNKKKGADSTGDVSNEHDKNTKEKKTKRNRVKGKRTVNENENDNVSDEADVGIDKENLHEIEEETNNGKTENKSKTIKTVTRKDDGENLEQSKKKNEKVIKRKAKIENVEKSKVDIENTKKSKETIDGKVEGQKKRSLKKDDFFMDHIVEVTDDENTTDAEDSEEEFTAPVTNHTENPNIVSKKKNRMGQRDRKRLLDIKHGREDPRKRSDFGGRGGGRGRGGRGGMDRGRGGFDRGRGRMDRGRGRDFSNNRGQGRENFRQRSNVDKKEKKEVDESLHPSWQAKQRQKNQQIITGFSGTKITFDD